MKILIVGIKGFIGSHLAEYCKVNSHEVFGCDVAEYKSNPYYFQVARQQSNYEPVIKNVKPELCIFAGGNGSVPHSISEPAYDFQLNTVNLFSLLNALKQNSPSCKFIHISSAAVYGNPARLPISEKSSTAPLSPYGWHKLLSEKICSEFYSLYNLRTISLRVFSVYGEGLKKQIFWDLYKKSIENTNITLFGTGNESRDFIHIKDLVNSIMLIAEAAPFDGSTINVSSGIETTIRNAASLFCKLLNPEIEITFNQQVKQGDPLHWRADIRKINQLGFKLSISLQEGLSYYIKWLKENESH